MYKTFVEIDFLNNDERTRISERNIFPTTVSRFASRQLGLKDFLRQVFKYLTLEFLRVLTAYLQLLFLIFLNKDIKFIL